MNLEDLNPPQRAAVRCTERPCLVLAGAGSGKTGVITRKIAWLIDQGYRPSQIAAVTFTNKAAREMKQRVARLLRGRGSHGLRVSTFHSLGQQILRREAHRLGYRRSFSILDGRDVEACLGELAARGERDGEAQRRASLRISRWKNDFISPDAALASAADPEEAAQARLYAAYREHMLACNAMDFDDLIMLPVALFRDDETVLDRWRERIRYLLVDEYQDTNTSQYELIRQLTALRGKLTVVGDDDQSIYAWRGARPENLARLQRDYPALEVIKLEQNYRSSGRILAAANRLIANNRHLFAKKLWSAAGDGERIRVLPCRNADDEADRIAVDIVSRRLREQARYADCAILYRSNFQSRGYEKALREHSIPYQVTGGNAFFERREIKDLVAWLRLLANPDDDPALLRVINVPRREIGAATVRAVADRAAARKRGLDAAMREFGLLESLPRRARLRLGQFTDLVDELRREAETLDAMALVRLLIERIDYRDWLGENATSAKQAEAAWENVCELVSWVGNLQKDRERQTLAEIMQHLALMSILESQEAEEARDAVQLMTLHAAKGLEFAHVYLAGFEEECLPHHQSRDEEGLEEERRLAYVGITRAGRSLALSYAKTRHKFGETLQCEPSRFLYELPAEHLDGAEHVDDSRSAEEKHQRGLDALADLKALLGATD